MVGDLQVDVARSGARGLRSSLRALASGLLALGLLGVAGAQSSAPSGARSEPSQAQPAPSGSFEVRLYPHEGSIQPSAELVLTDPQGRKTGVDPRSQKRFQGIPESSYEQEGLDDDETGVPGPVTLVLYVRNPVLGVYRLQVIARSSGRYSLEIRALDRELKPSQVRFLEVQLARGYAHAYRIPYSGTPGLKVEAPSGIRPSAER